MRRIGVKVLLLGLAALGVWSAWPRARVAGGDEPPPRAESPRVMGVATCASTACHNGNGPKGSVGSEYTTWAGHDKHARAYQVLYDTRSVLMVKNLSDSPLMEREDGKVKPPTRQPLCLKCHATGEGKAAHDGESATTGPRFALADGVGCESCHGAAEKYLSVHYRDGYSRKSDEEKWKVYGMAPTKNLGVRVELCAGCHVGDAASGKEVNHDLYAAGHPRLNFEFAAFHHQYPKHWGQVRKDGSPHPDTQIPDFEARLWTLGQATCARATLGLLKKRADEAQAKKETAPWPEFAEYDCYACHKTLRPNSPRQQFGFGEGRVPGSLPWGTWNWTAGLPLAKQANLKLDEDWAKLRTEMELPTPDPAEVSRLAASVFAATKDWPAQFEKNEKFDAKQFLKQLLENNKRGEALTWDEATQMYLALNALQPAREKPAAMRDLRTVLLDAFPAPTGKGPVVESPMNFNAAEANKVLGTIRTNLGDK
jgi:hypothetical protein